MATILINIITAYRYCISPLFIKRCRFYPTCSSYALEAIQKYGAIKGTWLACKRICRCHPFHEGGIDLVPEPTKNQQQTTAE